MVEADYRYLSVIEFEGHIYCKSRTELFPHRGEKWGSITYSADQENEVKDNCCRRQEEPGIQISTLLLQTHARQLYSLTLTRFCSILLNLWVFHYECMKWMECIWYRVSTIPVHVAFKCSNVILQPHSVSSELRSVLSWPQARSKSVVRALPEKREVRDCCSSDLICSSLISLKLGVRGLFLLGAGFYTNKTIIFVVSQSWRFYHCACVYVRKEKLLIFRQYRQSFATGIPLNHFVHHEISQLHYNKPCMRKTQSYHG